MFFCRSSQQTQASKALCRPLYRAMQDMRGFTLLELVIAIGLVAIMTAWGAPALQRLVHNQRLKSVAVDFNSALALARAESYGQGRRLVIAKKCHIENNCGTTGVNSNWSAGYSVYVCRSDSTVAADQAATNSRQATVDNCFLSTSYNAVNVKMVVQPFTKSIRMCADGNAGGFYNSHALLIDANSLVWRDRPGSPLGPAREVVSLTNRAMLYFYQEYGNSDLIQELELSPTAMLTLRRIEKQNMGDTGGDLASPPLACEPTVP